MGEFRGLDMLDHSELLPGKVKAAA
jgi:hypothetical protein